jgi:hypothetical protein
VLGCLQKFENLVADTCFLRRFPSSPMFSGVAALNIHGGVFNIVTNDRGSSMTQKNIFPVSAASTNVSPREISTNCGGCIYGGLFGHSEFAERLLTNLVVFGPLGQATYPSGRNIISPINGFCHCHNFWISNGRPNCSRRMNGMTCTVV